MNRDTDKDKELQTTKEEEKTMAVLAKPVNRMVTLDSQASQRFIKNFNENNKSSQEFIKSCERAGRLFKKGKNESEHS